MRTDVGHATSRTDPNADLIGREFDGPGGVRWKVIATTPWSSQYVETENVSDLPERRSCANAKLLRESLR